MGSSYIDSHGPHEDGKYSFRCNVEIEDIANSLTDAERFGRMVKCSVCKKDFLPAPMHIYKKPGKIYCSYTCARKDGWDT